MAGGYARVENEQWSVATRRGSGLNTDATPVVLLFLAILVHSIHRVSFRSSSNGNVSTPFHCFPFEKNDNEPSLDSDSESRSREE